MVSGKLKFLLVAGFISSGVFGCAPVDQGRMGVWGRPEFLWASCECTRPRDENAIRARNINFDTGAGKNCGGDNPDARNAWCGQRCDSAGYASGEYKMCLM